MRRLLLFFGLSLAAGGAVSRLDYANVERKFHAIETYRVLPGTQVSISESELNAYVKVSLPRMVPEGIRAPLISLRGGNVVFASAWVDFAKLRNQDGDPPGWLASKMFDGEHEVRVTAVIQSGGGEATVLIRRVEIAGVVLQGVALDFLIQNYLGPSYPAASIGQPFKLDYHIDRITVRPAAADVVIKN